MEFELGQTYSGYKFLDVVGRSRSAVQYRVQNTLAQRVESLRTLTAAALDDPDAAERFLREVRIRARLSHPHIITFYTAVPIEGRMAMTTELPDSLSLAERLKLGPLPWQEALDITRQILEALGCIHQQSFVHCGITPETILFGPNGFCKLADFSLARPLEPAHNLPEAGVVVGNPRYISPEQVKGERGLDQRSDLYSVGIVLYEMLCGRPPFESRSQFELMMAHVNQAPTPPSVVQPKVPVIIDALVLKSLAKEAGDRYPSAAAFATAIAEVTGGPTVEAGPPAEVSEALPPAAILSATAPAPVAAPVQESVPPAVTAIAAPVMVPEAVAASEPVVETTPQSANGSPAGAHATEPDSGWSTVAVLASAPDIKTTPEPVYAAAAAVASPVPEAVTVPQLDVVAEPGPASVDALGCAVNAELARAMAEVDLVAEEAPVSAAAAVQEPDTSVEHAVLTPEYAEELTGLPAQLSVTTAEASDVEAAMSEPVALPTLEAVQEFAEVVEEPVVVHPMELSPVIEAATPEAVPEAVAVVEEPVVVPVMELSPITEVATPEAVQQSVAVLEEPVVVPVIELSSIAEAATPEASRGGRTRRRARD